MTYNNKIDLRNLRSEELAELRHCIEAEIQSRQETIERVDFFLTFDINLVSQFLESKGFQWEDNVAVENTDLPTWKFSMDKPLSEKKLKKLMKEANRLEALEGDFE